MFAYRIIRGRSVHIYLCCVLCLHILDCGWRIDCMGDMNWYGRRRLQDVIKRRMYTRSHTIAAYICTLKSQFGIIEIENHIYVHCPPHTHPMMCIKKHTFSSYMYTHLRFFLEIALRWYSYDSFMFSIFSLTMITAYEYELSEILLYK